VGKHSKTPFLLIFSGLRAARKSEKIEKVGFLAPEKTCGPEILICWRQHIGKTHRIFFFWNPGHFSFVLTWNSKKMHVKAKKTQEPHSLAPENGCAPEILICWRLHIGKTHNIEKLDVRPFLFRFNVPPNSLESEN
jgi:hypothetical protein